MPAYYNEIDSKAAAWLRELIKQGHIAPGEVDERSIEDVKPSELMGYTQCHFFAGIGVWSYALRQAGWSDDQPVWTGSCPCQPFSAAGKGAGFDDERHLWPAFYHLISQCQPSVVFGEQVASKDGLAWLDLVQADLEGAGYAVGASDICAAGFGAPHIRQRLYWVADAQSGQRRLSVRRRKSRENSTKPERNCSVDALADSQSQRQQQFQNVKTSRIFNETIEQAQRLQSISGCRSGISSLANTSSDGHSSASQPAHFRRLEQQSGREAQQDECIQSTTECCAESGRLEWALPGPVNGFWRDADWLRCRDDKWRSVRPGSFPLVDGTPARVGRLRGYGNAIVAPVAQAFIEAYLDLEV